MKEINIASVIINKRKEKGITQESMAAYLGVSKAAISKWETGQSYPDIVLLPLLASYFNISVDDLIGYEPQMTKEDIKKTYQRFREAFARESFDDLFAELKELIRKYYTCYPLLSQLGILLINHVSYAGSQDKMSEVIEEARCLFKRIETECQDFNLIRQARAMEAYCCLMQNNPQTALVLLEDITYANIGTEVLCASAYQMMGELPKAQSALQIGIYQNLVGIYGNYPAFLIQYASEPRKFEEAVKRIQALTQTWALETLHPAILLPVLLSIAQGYAIQGNTERTIEFLKQYTDLCTGDIYPLKLQGDDFFDGIQEWIDEFDLGSDTPTSEETVKKNIVRGLTDNPIYDSMKEDLRFQQLVERLRKI